MTVKMVLWPPDVSNITKRALPHVKSPTERYGAQIHVL